MKTTSDGRQGGLLIGPTDKEGGKGIPATVIGGRNVILGGNEVIINENAALLHCEELNRINQSTGGRAIPCDLQKNNNTHTEMAKGGKLPQMEVVLYTKSTGKPLKSFKGWWEASEWIDKNIKEEDHSKYELEGYNDILSHEEVEAALGRPIRFFNDYVVTIKGFEYEKMGLRTTYQRK